MQCGKQQPPIQGLPAGRYKVIYVALTTGSVLDTHNTLAAALGVATQSSRAAAWGAIREHISRLVREARQFPVLIFDEAHLMRNEVLEDLRLIGNFNMDAEQRFCMVLVGSGSLKRRLAMAVHEALAQRLILRHQMGPLTREEIEPWLGHRLVLAGAPADVPLFQPAAVEALYLASKGVPRILNNLAHYALLAAARDEERRVSPDHVARADGEIRM